MRITHLLCIAAVCVLPLTSCGSSSLTAGDLKMQAQTVQSLAAESALLDTDVADGNTLPQYTLARAGELADAARSSAENLQQPAADSTVGQHAQRLAADCRELAGYLERLQKSPTEATARQMKPQVDDLSRRVQSEAGGL